MSIPYNALATRKGERTVDSAARQNALASRLEANQARRDLKEPVREKAGLRKRGRKSVVLSGLGVAVAVARGSRVGWDNINGG